MTHRTPGSIKALVDYFDCVYVINLPYRTDRKRNVEREFKIIGCPIGEKVQLFEAIRPTHKGEFYALGAKGSFYSHRAALRAALDRNTKNVLICEDDIKFLNVKPLAISKVIDALKSTQWDIVYLGYLSPPTPPTDEPLIDWNTGTLGGHFYAVNGPFIPEMIKYMDECEARPRDHSEGGPSGRDGVYNHLLLVRPQTRVLLANPNMAVQRSSRSDISPKIFDTWLVRPVSAAIRSLLRVFS